MISSLLSAQNDIPIGSWRTHSSFRDAHSVAITATGVYCAGPNSLFFLDFEDQNLTRLSKIDGLSDAGIASIGYHPDLNILLIAYSNGNLDLLKDNQVTNINTIQQSPSPGPKSVSHILFYNNLAYLSTSFGVVVIDLVKFEVAEALQNIGEDGETIAINFSAVYNDTLFLASVKGIMGGSLDPSVNLQDFRNWRHFNASDGIPETGVSTVASNSTQLLATINDLGIYAYQSPHWSQLDYDGATSFHYAASGSPILITEQSTLLSIGVNNDIEPLVDPLFPHPQSARSLNSQLWIADSVNALVTNSTGEFVSLFPTGPFSDSVASVHYQGGSIIGLPPGYDQVRSPIRTGLGFYFFKEGAWSNYNSTQKSDTKFFPLTHDLVDVSYNQIIGRYYLASFGQGIIEWEPDGEIRVLDNTAPGSTLENTSAVGQNVLVSSVSTDDQGMLWATNYGNPSPVHRYDPQNENWTAFSSNFHAGRYPLDIQVAQNGDLWLRLDVLEGGGIMVLNPQSNQQKHLTNVANEGGLPSRNINDLTIDLQGQVWLATDNGVFHYPFPFDILSNPGVNASPVLIDGRPLLANEPVRCITVDGGNRKWIGTENGIWLVSATGDAVVSNFNVNNSALPSNRVLDVAVYQNTGEVFMVTDLGIISFRGTSTGAEIFQESAVKIFPNPVFHGFNGQVGISGLVRDAIVKVSDITGKLVKELRAAGGTAVWDVSDFQGRRVESGVYLVFSSSEDGNETFIGKIAVIN